MSTALRIGMIGLDTSHVPSFTKLLNDSTSEHHISGGQVVAAYPGGSEDFEASWSRVKGFTAELRDVYNVEILDSPAAVAEAVDLVFIMSVDGRVHLDQFRETLRYRRPTYIDKPLATSLADAQEIFRLAEETAIPVMSSSAMRYVDSLAKALAENKDAIVGCDVFGPMSEEPTQPGLFWYGIHTVEVLVSVMGPGCQEVRAVRTEGADLITFTYPDGRLASLHGLRRGTNDFGLTLHRLEKGPCPISLNQTTRPRYAGLLEAIFRSLPTGVSDVPADETLEVIRLIEAANESRQANGRLVNC